MAENFLEMYLEDVKAVPEFAPGEEADLLGRVLGGEKAARSRLVEGSLMRAVGLAREYEDRGLLLQDLIQEANCALAQAASAYDGSGDWRYFSESLMRQALAMAVKSQEKEKEAGENVRARVNVLTSLSQEMAERLGRQATVEELARAMKMDPDEIREIMKIALDAVQASEAAKFPVDF